MTDKERKAFKTEVLEACKKNLLEKVYALKKEMDECQQAANDYGPPKDRYDAFRTQLLRKRDLIAQQLSIANKELSVISILKADTLKKKIELGSVVISDSYSYFVSSSLGAIKSGVKEIMCISPAVPIFKVLSGLKPGDKTVFNGKTIQIKDVF